MVRTLPVLIRADSWRVIPADPDYHQLKQLTTLDVHQMLRRYMSKLHLHSVHHDHIGVFQFCLFLRVVPKRRYNTI